MTTDTITRNAALHHAVSLLAGVCDGAREQDGVGFNSLDTKFGKRVAGIMPEDWTEEIVIDVSAILPVYAKQLARYGVTVAELPLVKDARRNPVARDQARAAERKTKYGPNAVLTGTTVKVFRSFDIKDALKAAGYRWSGYDKAWQATLDQATAQVLIDQGVDVSQCAEEVKAAASAPVVRKPVGTVIYDARADLIIIKCDKGVIPLDVMRDLPGRKWDPVNYVNTVFPEPVVLEVVERYGLDVHPNAREAITSAVARLAASSATSVENYQGALKGTLRGYQEAGVAYAVENPHSINADEMGTGKTLQAIAAAETKGMFPILVTCPASLRANWVREVAQWTPWRTASIWDGKGEAPDTDYVIVSYEGMTKAVRG